MIVPMKREDSAKIIDRQGMNPFNINKFYLPKYNIILRDDSNNSNHISGRIGNWRKKTIVSSTVGLNKLQDEENIKYSSVCTLT